MSDAGLSGFAKGFANGFINERNRRLDAEKETDQMGLRYRLEDLAKQKSDWQKKSEEETQYIDDGKTLSKLVGDPEFAADAAKLRKSGLSTDQVLDMWKKGNFKKKTSTQTTANIPNPDLPANRMDMKLPAGVVQQGDLTFEQSPKTTSDWQSPELTQVANNISKDGAQYPATVDEKQLIKTNNVPTDNMTKDGAKFPATVPNTEELNKYDEQARKVAPGLFDYKTKNDPSSVLNQDSSYEFVPEEKEIKFGSLSEETYKLQMAIKTNDKVKIADQKQKVDIMKNTAMEQARIQAEAQGKNVQYYAVTDKNGKYVQSVLAERGDNGQPINPLTQQPIVLDNGMTPHLIDKETNDDIRKIQSEFRKPAAEYDVAAESTAEAFDLGKKITDLLDKPGNDVLVTSSAGVLQYANNAFTEVQAAQKLILNQSNTTRQAIADGNPEDISASIANMEQSLIGLEKTVAQLPNNVLSDKNAQIALDKTLFDNYTQLFAYKLAQANGQTGNNQSNKDVDRFMSILGNKDSNSQAVKASLFTILQMQKTKIDQKRVALDANYKTAGNTFGFDLNLAGRRMGDIIQDPNVRVYYNNVDAAASKASQYTVDEFAGANIRHQQMKQAQQPVEQKDEFGLVIGKQYPFGGKMYEYMGGGKDKGNFKEVQ